MLGGLGERLLSGKRCTCGLMWAGGRREVRIGAIVANAVALLFSVRIGRPLPHVPSNMRNAGQWSDSKTERRSVVDLQLEIDRNAVVDT